MPSDGDLLPLVERMASGDPEGLAALHRLLGPHVLAAIEAIVGPGPRAESLLHDVFLRLWTEAPQYDRHFGRPAIWAFLTARELAVGSLDRAARAALDGSLEIAAGHPVGDLPEPERDALIRAWKGLEPVPDAAADALLALVGGG